MLTALILVVLFVAERTHQWVSLVGPPRNRATGRRYGTALAACGVAIGFLEGSAASVDRVETFWAAVFLALVAHVALTEFGVMRRRSRGTARERHAGWIALDGAFSCGLGCTAFLFVRGGGGDAGWLGMPPGFRSDLVGSAGVLMASLSGLAMLLRRPLPSVRRALLLRAGGLIVLWALNASLAPRGGVALALWAIVVHSLPSLRATLVGFPRSERFRRVGIGGLLALIEWFVVARIAWFPSGFAFPDLENWVDPGRSLWIVILPLWISAFFGHMIVDFVRYFEEDEAD